MALIPKANLNKSKSMNVAADPTRSISSAGIAGKALQGLGQNISAAAKTFHVIEQKQDALEADAWASSAASKTAVKVNERTAKLKQEAPENHAMYTEFNAKMIDEEIENTAKLAPSKVAADVFRNRFRSTEKRAKIAGFDYEKSQKTKYLYALDARQTNDDAATLTQAPDVQEAIKKIGQLESRLDMPDKYTTEQTTQLSSQGRSELFTGLMGGYENSNNPKEALEILSGKHPGSKELLASIDDKKVQQWNRVFMRQARVGTKVKLSLLNNKVTDIESAIMDQTMYVDPREISQLHNQLLAAGEVRKASSVMVLARANDMVKEAKTMTNTEIDAALARGVENTAEFRVTGVTNAADKKRLAIRMTTTLKNIKEERKNNGGEYALKQFPVLQSLATQAADTSNAAGMREFSISSKKHQEELKIKNPKALNNFLAEKYKEAITPSDYSKTGIALASSALAGIKSGFGDESPKVAAELVERGLITNEQAYMFYLDDPDSVESLMKLQNPEQLTSIKKSYDTYLKSNPETSANDHKVQLAKTDEFKNFHDTMVNQGGVSGNLPIVTTVQSIMEKDFQQLVGSGTPPDTAIQVVTDKYVSKNWAFTDNTNKLIIPKTLMRKNGYNVQRIEDNAEKLQGMLPYLKDTMEIPTPPEYIRDDAKGATNRFKKDLSNRAKWITNAAMDGVVLVMSNGGETDEAVPGKPIYETIKGKKVIVGHEEVTVSYRKLNNGYEIGDEGNKNLVGAYNSLKEARKKQSDDSRARLMHLGRNF